jgi:hypothetical protein
LALSYLWQSMPGNTQYREPMRLPQVFVIARVCVVSATKGCRNWHLRSPTRSPTRISLTDGNIKAAVTAWVTAATTAATTYGPIGDWDTSAVTDMTSLFSSQLFFNDDIGGWNVASVTSMKWTFWQAERFNQNIAAWNTASVTIMCGTQFGLQSGIFQSASAFDQNLAAWNVLRVTDLNNAFGSTNTGASYAPLSDCNKRAIYSAWGATLQKAFPTWSSASCSSRCERVRLIRMCLRPGTLARNNHSPLPVAAGDCGTSAPASRCSAALLQPRSRGGPSPSL